MSENEMNQTVGEAVAERNQARRELACVNRKLVQAGNEIAAVGTALSSMPEGMDQLAEDVLVRRLRELPEASLLAQLIADRRKIESRLCNAEEFLRSHGV